MWNCSSLMPAAASAAGLASIASMLAQLRACDAYAVSPRRSIQSPRLCP
jgi:hypothetical protein